MDDKGETRGDLRLPEGALGQTIQKDFDDGKEMLVSVTAAAREHAYLYLQRPCWEVVMLHLFQLIPVLNVVRRNLDACV